MANTKIPSELIADNSVGIAALNVSDGSDGQALTTNGAGTLSFSTISSGATSLNGLSDCKTFGTSSLLVGDSDTGTINAANYNTGLGVQVFNALTSGDENVMIGFAAGQTLTTGSHNIGIGVNAVDDVSTGSFNVGIGTHAVGSTTTASNNTGVGYAALFANTTGAENTAVGSSAMLDNTTGNYNVAVGREALQNNTTGSQNIAIGLQCLNNNTTASNNVGIGFQALYPNTTGTNNTAVGQGAMGSNTTAYNNTALGQGALSSATTGFQNTALGRSAANAVTTAANNTCIGYAAGDDLTTGGQNVIIGTLCDAGNSGRAYATVIGYSLSGGSNDATLLGRGTTDSQLLHGAETWTAPSDVRLKEEIEDEQIGLDFINELRPVTFRWKKGKDVPKEMKAHMNTEERVMNGKYNHGFIAQEVKETIDKYNFKDGFDLWSEDDNDGRQRLGKSALIPMLVKAIQELSAEVETLKSQLGE